MKKIRGGVTAPRGFSAGGVFCGIKASRKKDLMLVVSDGPCAAGGVFTTNRVRAHCVERNLRLLRNRPAARAVIANSGNANCLTGPSGRRHTEMMAKAAADALGIGEDEVLVASTGVIGKRLPIERLMRSVPDLVSGLRPNPAGNQAAAQAILTTDTVIKEMAVKLGISGRTVRIGAIAKGSGMIHPEMTPDGLRHATMLCFITTDAVISPDVLQRSLEKAIRRSFNMISVDGDMSTNDMVLLLANAKAKNRPIREKSAEEAAFTRALGAICLHLAKAMVRDGEGATKFVEIQIKGARSEADAREAGLTVASSSLVKTALFGCDPNWGRLAASVGTADVEMNPAKLQVKLGRHWVLSGNRVVKQKKAELARLFRRKNIKITLDLGAGRCGATVWTSDLSTQYVRINSAYRT